MTDDTITTTRRMRPLGGSTLSYLDEGSGPPLLLGHGYLWDWRMWEPQVEAFASRCRVIVPELWGHGASGPMPAGTVCPIDLATQMLELLDMLEIERCVVAGSSVGGMWAAHLAAMAPKRVAGLVLLNSYLGAEPAPARRAYAAMLDRVAATGDVPLAIAEAIIAMVFAPATPERAPQVVDLLLGHIGDLDAQTLRRTIVPLGRAIFDRPDALDILSEIVAPTLIVTGAQDRARPPHESMTMARLLDAKIIEIPGCGHSATLECPDEVTAAITRFLDSLAWAKGPRRDAPTAVTQSPIGGSLRVAAPRHSSTARRFRRLRR